MEVTHLGSECIINKMEAVIRESMIEEYVLRQQKELRLSTRETMSLMKTLLLGFMLKKITSHHAVCDPLTHRIKKITLEPATMRPLMTLTPMPPITRGNLSHVIFPTVEASSAKVVPHDLWVKHTTKHNPLNGQVA